MIQPIRKIGNSSGIVLPKIMLKTVGIEDEVEIEVRDKTILLRPVRRTPREGWAEAFQKAAAGEKPEVDGFEGLSNDTLGNLFAY